MSTDNNHNTSGADNPAIRAAKVADYMINTAKVQILEAQLLEYKNQSQARESIIEKLKKELAAQIETNQEYFDLIRRLQKDNKELREQVESYGNLFTKEQLNRLFDRLLQEIFTRKQTPEQKEEILNKLTTAESYFIKPEEFHNKPQ